MGNNKTNEVVDIGLLTPQEYKNRISKTLKDNPDAILNETDEVKSYLSTQGRSYLEEINKLSNSTGPLKTSTRLIVTIIGYGEGGRIKNTLNLYLNQDISTELFEIIVLNNHPREVPDDDTGEQVAEFISENPKIKVHYIHKIWDDSQYKTVGNARKYVFDISLSKILNRRYEKDTILVSNDADPIYYAPNYLSSILNKFDTSPDIDCLVTDINFPEYAMKKPGVLLAIEILAYLERNLIKENKELGEPADPAILLGGSSAMRASIYAAIGGSNARATTHDDRELGWLMGDARNWNPNKIIQFDDTYMTTDARRQLSAAAEGSAIDQTLMGFHSRPELRKLDNFELLKLISDDIDWEFIEDGIGSTWHSQNTGNKLYQKKFVPVFESMMERMGIKYAIENGEFVLKNIDRFVERLSKQYGREVKIIHSKPRVYTLEKINELKAYFGSLCVGVIGARQLAKEQTKSS